MSTIGSALKEARTKKAISLEDVHSRIKIHPRVLQLLEEDKFEKLPSPLFVKSFLKSYAEFLEINAEELVESYEKEKKRDPEQVLYLKPADASVSTGFHPFYIVAGIAAAALMLFVLVGEPSKIGAKLLPKTKKAAAVSKPKKEAPKETPKEASAPRKEAPPAAGSSDWLNSAAMGNFPKIAKGTPLSLEIKALDAVWVHVTSDGTVVFQGILKKGASEAWSAKSSLEIWTGNASNMALTVNKTLLGSPGKGVVKKMIISREGIRIATPPKS